MAVKKRATKKATPRKSTRKSTTQPRQKTRRLRTKKRSSLGLFSRLLMYLVIFLVISGSAISAIYYFGSFATRNQLNRVVIDSLNPIRTTQWLPRPITSLFDLLYDKTPTSEGLIVDGGELGRDEGFFLAGIPQTKTAVRMLQNRSHTNIYDERERQTLCIALRVNQLAPLGPLGRGYDTNPLKDPQVPHLKTHQMEWNEWIALPLLQPSILAQTSGAAAASEAMLLSNLVPLKQRFADEVWNPLIENLIINYSSRFDEIWMYVGPVYKRERSKLSSGVPIPDALYAIVFDITDSGGLRALSLIVPTNVTAEVPLKNHIVSIKEIEAATDLRFLPELGFDIDDLLLNWKSPTLW